MKSKNLKTDENTRIKLIVSAIVILGIGVAVGYFSHIPRVIPTLKDGTQVIASIDGKKFTTENLYDKIKNVSGHNALIELIDEYIMNKEIKDTSDVESYADEQVKSLKANYGDDWANFLAYYNFADDEALRNYFIKDTMRSDIAKDYIKKNEITDKEIKTYYDKEIEGALSVRYVLLQPINNDTMTSEEVKEEEKKAETRAKEVITKLKNGEKFEDLAKEYSDDSSTASNGGLYENILKQDVVEEFWNAAKALKDGAYTTSPVKSSYGYFVILRISQGEKPSLEDSKDQILEAILKKQLEEDTSLINKIWVKIRESYNLDIVDTDLKDAYDKVVKDLNQKKD